MDQTFNMDRVRLTSFGVYLAGRYGGLQVICPTPIRVKEVICVSKFAITLCYKISGTRREIKFPLASLHDLDNVRTLSEVFPCKYGCTKYVRDYILSFFNDLKN